MAKSLPFLRTADSAPVAGDERLGRVVEDRRGLGDQRVEVGVVERHRVYRLTAASASGSVNRPA